jgi:hypothetical protein
MIRLIEGSHLTATNKRHLEAILANGWRKGEAPRLAYQVEPIEGAADRWRFTIGKSERDDWGRVQLRVKRGIFERV